MKIQTIHDYVERLGNLVRVQARKSGSSHDLQPVQVEALHYLSVCNKYSDTLLTVAEYLGLTKGTTSQTIKVLETRGFLTKKPDKKDGRVAHLKVTSKGKRFIDKAIPAPVLKEGTKLISSKKQDDIISSLKLLLDSCQKGNKLKTFGSCHSCRHYLKSGKSSYCQLFDEQVTKEETNQICREHEYVVGK